MLLYSSSTFHNSNFTLYTSNLTLPSCLNSFIFQFSHFSILFQKVSRLLSLDILRGLTVAGMILVDSGTDQSFAPLKHSVWNGLTPCDMVFPLFLFIMGFSAYLSLRKFEFSWSPTLVRKVLRRTVVLVLLGLMVNWFILLIRGVPTDFSQLRYMGILQRIGLCYAAVSALAVSVEHRRLPWVAAGLLGLYTLILYMGNGMACDASNVLRTVDSHIFGDSHLYLDEGPVDPEGLLSLIPCVAHTVLGFCVGRAVCGRKSVGERMNELVRWSIWLICLGQMLTWLTPLNKRIWSPSYTLLTCGLAALMLLGIMYLTDRQPAVGRPRNPVVRFFQVFGVNPLFLYVTRFLLTVVMVMTGLARPLHQALDSVIPSAPWSALAYAVIMVTAVYAVGWVLDRKRIYIKI